MKKKNHHKKLYSNSNKEAHIEKESQIDSVNGSIKKAAGLKNLIEICILVISIVGVLISAFECVYVHIYRIVCSRFYGIPDKYFSIPDNGFLKMGLVAILFIVFFFPLYFRKDKIYGDKVMPKGFDLYLILMSIGLGLTMGLYNVDNLILILQNILSYKLQNTLISRCGSLAIISVFAFTTIIFPIYVILAIYLADIQQSIKKEWLKKILNVMFFVTFFISAVILIYGSIFRFSISVDKQTQFEVTTIKAHDYIVLSDVNKENILIAKYNTEKNQINTSSYQIVSRKNLVLHYIDTTKPPKIEKH